MARGKRWRREELLVLLNVYHKLPFGLLDERQKVIRDVAEKMNRTPGSVAMKLVNFASLDPVQQARGVKGLPGASALDKKTWAEFQGDRETLAAESETLLRRLFEAKDEDSLDLVKGAGVKVRKAVHRAPAGSTETKTEVKARRGQDFFRQMVLNAYDGQCGVTKLPVRELLVASHVLPWARYPEERLNPQNGLCLSRLYDGAFDRGLVTFDDDLRLVTARTLKDHLPNVAVEKDFIEREGQTLFLPEGESGPRRDFLAVHRREVFLGR